MILWVGVIHLQVPVFQKEIHLDLLAGASDGPGPGMEVQGERLGQGEFEQQGAGQCIFSETAFFQPEMPLEEGRVGQCLYPL